MHPIGRQPPEGIDCLALAREHCQHAIQDIDTARQSPAETRHIHLDDARAEFAEAAYWCAQASGQAYAALQQAKRERGEAEGKLKCGKCENWFAPDEIEAYPYGYQSSKVDAPPPSVYYRCRKCGR
jgi:hypothetical protein